MAGAANCLFRVRNSNYARPCMEPPRKSVYFSVYFALFLTGEGCLPWAGRGHINQPRIPPENIAWRIFLLSPSSCSQSRKR
jgi:hypothetical protein